MARDYCSCDDYCLALDPHSKTPNESCRTKMAKSMTDPKRQRLFYEIKAAAFHVMTGHTAPDQGEVCPMCKEEWERWLADNGECVKALLSAVDTIMDLDIDDWY